MNLLITGDRQEFDSKSFKDRLDSGLEQLGICLADVTKIIRTAYGGAELRAHELANQLNIPVEQILPVETGFGKHARADSISRAFIHADKAIVFDAKKDDEHVTKILNIASGAEVPFVVV